MAGRAAGLLAGLAVLAACSSSSSAFHVTSSAVTPTPVIGSPVPTSGAFVAGCPAGTEVAGPVQLAVALANAAPGTTIIMAPGIYAGQFVADAKGTQQAPIWLCGTRDAVIDGGDTKSGYDLHLDGAAWWNLVGFTLQGGQKGVVTDHASHNVISGLYVHDIGDEAIHLRSASTDNIVENNMIRDTGLNRAFYGEGIYVGSAKSNWCKYSGCQPDRSDRNIVRNNDISETTAENIDIKEGTTGGSIIGNHLSGLGMNPSSATAWVNVKGNAWTVVGNTGQTSVKDGFQVHEILAGWGVGNVFRQNHAVVDGPGYGFYVQHNSLGTIVTCDNTEVGAAMGLSNTPCTQ